MANEDSSMEDYLKSIMASSRLATTVVNQLKSREERRKRAEEEESKAESDE